MKRIRPLQLMIALGLLALGVLPMTAAYAAAQGASPAMTVTPPAAFAVSQPLSDLPPPPPTGPVAKKIHPLHPLPHHGPVADSNAYDDALQTHPGPYLKHKKGANFPGVSANGYYPADPNIAVGPNYIVQAVNVEIGIYDKSGNILSG
jgi:hypothetical protein